MTDKDKILFIKTSTKKQGEVSDTYSSSIIHVHDDASNGKKQKDSLFIGSCQITDVYNTNAEDSWVTEKVGGLPSTSATTMKTKTVSEVLDMILYPTKQPTKTDPSVTLTYGGSLSTLIKVGTTLPSKSDFTATVSKGTLTYKNAAGDTNYAGEPGDEVFYINDGDTLWGTSSGEGTYTVKCVVPFAEGSKPLDNKGGESTLDAYAGGDVTSNTISFVSVYPIYSNTSAIKTMTEQTLLNYNSNVSIDLSIPDEIDGTLDKFRFSLPYNVGIVSVYQFNTLTKAFDISIKVESDGTETRNSMTYNKYVRTKDMFDTQGTSKYRLTIKK